MTLSTLQLQANELLQLPIIPSFQSRLEKFIKGSLIQAQVDAQVNDTLLNTRVAERAQAA